MHVKDLVLRGTRIITLAAVIIGTLPLQVGATAISTGLKAQSNYSEGPGGVFTYSVSSGDDTPCPSITDDSDCLLPPGGTYVVQATEWPTDYSPADNVSCNLAVPSEGFSTCEISWTYTEPEAPEEVHLAQTGTITLVKTLVEGQEGPLAPNDFTLHVSNVNEETDMVVTSGEPNELAPGVYAVSEDEEDGYAMTNFSCDNAVLLDVGMFELAAADNITCTFTNAYSAPPATLTVHKEVVSFDDEEDDTPDLEPSDFQLYVNGEPVSQNHAASYAAGSYSVSESLADDLSGDEFGIDGYTQSTITCTAYAKGQEETEEVKVDADGVFAMESGKSYDCTVTNDEDAGGWLNVRLKFRDRHGNLLEEQPGDVSVWVDCEESQPADDNRICGTPEEEVPPQEEPEHIFAKAFSHVLAMLVPAAHAATIVPLAVGSPTFVGPGTFTVGHSSLSGYNATFTGNCTSFGIVNIDADEDQTCVITFTQNGGGGGGGGGGSLSPSTLTVTTVVINDDGGALASGDVLMTMTSAGPGASFPGTASGQGFMLPAGAYDVTSPAVAGYSRSDSGNCSGSLSSGTSVTCIVTYDDNDAVIPPVVPPAVPPAPGVPVPTVLGATDTDTSAPTALPRTGASAFPLVLSALSAAIVAASRKKRA